MTLILFINENDGPPLLQRFTGIFRTVLEIDVKETLTITCNMDAKSLISFDQGVMTFKFYMACVLKIFPTNLLKDPFFLSMEQGII